MRGTGDEVANLTIATDNGAIKRRVSGRFDEAGDDVDGTEGLDRRQLSVTRIRENDVMYSNPEGESHLLNLSMANNLAPICRQWWPISNSRNPDSSSILDSSRISIRRQSKVAFRNQPVAKRPVVQTAV